MGKIRVEREDWRLLTLVVIRRSSRPLSLPLTLSVLLILPCEPRPDPPPAFSTL